MLAEKTANGVEMRTKKAGLAEEHKQRMQSEYLAKAAAVKCAPTQPRTRTRAHS